MSVQINGTNGLTFNDGSSQQTAASGFGFKNRIINGAMIVNQRNTSITATGYATDRWQYNGSQTSKATVAQSTSVPAGSGFINSLLVTSSSAYTYGASDYFSVQQPIEGLNCADLMWGTANAKAVTVSFWVQASIAGTYSVCFINNTNNRSYVATYTVSATNTWQYVTITIPGDTSGTWTTDNTVGIKVWFSLGAGSTYAGSAGSWNGSLLLGATGQVNLLSTNGATFYITGVQLEKGSTATSFDYRPYGTELALCQRYLPAFNSTSSTDPIASGVVMTTTNFRMTVHFNVTPRVPPTGISTTTASGFTIITNGTGYTANGISFLYGSQMSSIVQVSTASTMVVGQGGYVYTNTTPGQILFTGCEL